jgi:hypothetical protein
MAIIAKASGDFKPAPEGVWPAVCVDVVDQGIVQPKNPKYRPNHRIQLRWVLQAEPPLEDGRPHMAVRGFGLSLGEKSNLRPFLEAWRGRSFTDEELEGFDVEKVIGVNCQLQILHRRDNGKVYGNVVSIMPAAKGTKKLEIPADYIRQHIRDEREKLEAEPDGPAYEDEPGYEAGESDIPF